MAGPTGVGTAAPSTLVDETKHSVVIVRQQLITSVIGSCNHNNHFTAGLHTCIIGVITVMALGTHAPQPCPCSVQQRPTGIK